MTFQHKIHLLLARHRMKQGDLARRTGADVRSIRDYMKGEHIPKMDTALKIARALGCPLDWLADDTKGLDDLKETA